MRIPVMTVKELAYLCKKEIKNGNGNKEIYLSDDDEGNGYHGLYFGFTTDPDNLKAITQFCNTDIDDIDNAVVLG